MIVGSVKVQQQQPQEHEEDHIDMRDDDKPQESKEQAIDCEEAHALHVLEALEMKSERQRRWESEHAEIARVFKSKMCNLKTSGSVAAHVHPGVLPLMVPNPDKPGEVML